MTKRRMALVTAGALVAALGAFVYFNYQRDIQLAHERVATGSRMVETPCGAIEYALAGVGPPVLILHGAGGGYDQGLEFGQALVRRGFRVIAVSRFGYLRSALPADASAAAQADAYACLLDALDVRRAAAVGASAGAPSAMQFALRHPGRITALVLLVPVAYVPRARDAAPKQIPAVTVFLLKTALKSDFLLWAAMRLARPAVIRTMLATPPAVVENADADEQARITELLEHILPVSPRRFGLLNDVAVIAALPRYDLERIAAPTLIVGMEDDLLGLFDAARYTAAHIPHARFIGYPSGGHLWVGHQKELSSEIEAFLKKRRP